MSKTMKTFACIAIMIMILSIGMVVFATSDTSESLNEISVTSEQKTKKASNKKKGSKGTHANIIKIAASVLGQTEEEIKELVKTDKVGTLLINAGKVEEFKTAYLTETKTKLDSVVADGTITQEEADRKYSEAQEKMSAYDGTMHLCGKNDHSEMFQRKNKTTESI